MEPSRNEKSHAEKGVFQRGLHVFGDRIFRSLEVTPTGIEPVLPA